MAASNDPDPNWTLANLVQQDIDDLTELVRYKTADLIKMHMAPVQVTSAIEAGERSNREVGFIETVTGAVDQHAMGGKCVLFEDTIGNNFPFTKFKFPIHGIELFQKRVYSSINI